MVFNLFQDAETLRLAKLEVDILKSLPAHPNIVGYYGCVKRELSPDDRNKCELFILLEYCPNTLSNVLNARLNMPLKEVEILDYFAPICAYVIV